MSGAHGRSWIIPAACPGLRSGAGIQRGLDPDLSRDDVHWMTSFIGMAHWRVQIWSASRLDSRDGLELRSVAHRGATDKRYKGYRWLT